MDLTNIPELRDIALVAGICMASAAIGAVALLIVAANQIRHIEVPPDADFFETLQAVPITVPLALDLLDMAFDIFAAPIAWIILELLGLPALQAITIFEGLIPGTQLIPTLTAAWVVARLMKDKQKSDLQSALHDQHRMSREARLQQLRGERQNLLEDYRRKSLPAPGIDGEDVVEGEYYEEDNNLSGREREYLAEEERYYEEEYDVPPEYFDEDEF